MDGQKEVLALPTWEGDAIFLKLLIEEDERRFFTLRLVYEGNKLVENNCTGIHRKQIKFEIIIAQRLFCKQYLRNLI